jgi:hypothetical protein
VGIEEREPNYCGHPVSSSDEPVPGMPGPSERPNKLSERPDFRAAVYSSSKVPRLTTKRGPSKHEKRDSDGRERQCGHSAIPFAQSQFYYVCELPDFLVRGISRHEICDGLAGGETADECRTTGNEAVLRSRRIRSIPRPVAAPRECGSRAC